MILTESTLTSFSTLILSFMSQQYKLNQYITDKLSPVLFCTWLTNTQLSHLEGNKVFEKITEIQNESYEKQYTKQTDEVLEKYSRVSSTIDNLHDARYEEYYGFKDSKFLVKYVLYQQNIMPPLLSVSEQLWLSCLQFLTAMVN